jgi:hypothetical protein
MWVILPYFPTYVSTCHNMGGSVKKQNVDTFYDVFFKRYLSLNLNFMMFLESFQNLFLIFPKWLI